MRILIFFFLACLLFACNKSDDTFDITGETPPGPTQSVNVSVYLCPNPLDNHCENEQPLAGAKVILYATDEDRIFQENAVRQGTTPNTGRLTFNNLEKTTYYAFVETQHGVDEDYFQIPAGGSANYLFHFYGE